MANHNILITSAGQRVSLVRAFQKELKKLNAAYKVYTVDLNPVLAPACHVSDGYRQVKRVSDDNYIEDLLQYCKEWNIRLIVPTIDTELQILAAHKVLFEQNGITAVVSDLAVINICRDKRQTNSFFKEKTIDIPQAVDKNSPTFPLFIKPYDGSLSKDIFLINQPEQLTEYHMNNPKLMFMEYIDPAEYDEYTVDTYYDKNGVLKCAVPRKRMVVRAGEINKGVTRKNSIIRNIVDKLSQLDGACGCLTMQFFFNSKSGRVIGIEINPRFGGGYPLSYLAGANYPEFLIREYMLNEEVAYFDGWKDNLLMLRYDAEVLVEDYHED